MKFGMSNEGNGVAVRSIRYVIALLVWAAPGAGNAEDLPAPNPSRYGAADDPIGDYFTSWFDRVDAALASQPHWMTPITTVTPRLEEEYRYDQFHQRLGNGAEIDNFFGGKGLELIPTTTNEVLINVPALDQRRNVKPATGFADWNFLTIKQRLLSADEEHGNYILTAFLGFQAPTGVPAFTNKAWVITPTIAGGVGYGDFDVQGTVSVPVPTANEHIIGTPVVSSLTLQYHVATYFWPEFAFNDTYWTSGVRHGKNQLFLSPGILLGRFHLYGRLKAVFGFAYQFAVSPDLTKKPVLTPVYDHAWLLTMRVSF